MFCLAPECGCQGHHQRQAARCDVCGLCVSAGERHQRDRFSGSCTRRTSLHSATTPSRNNTTPTTPLRDAASQLNYHGQPQHQAYNLTALWPAMSLVPYHPREGREIVLYVISPKPPAKLPVCVCLRLPRHQSSTFKSIIPPLVQSHVARRDKPS